MVRLRRSCRRERRLAVLEGDPMAASGDFTIRLKMPDGYKSRSAHASAPGKRNGDLRHAEGRHGRHVRRRQDDELRGRQLRLSRSQHAPLRGGVGETVIQIHGESPVKFNYINPADDPSMKK